MKGSCTPPPGTIHGHPLTKYVCRCLPAKLHTDRNLIPQIFLLTRCPSVQPIGARANACPNACASLCLNNIVPDRLYAIGCMWGFVLVMLWKAMAGFEGVLATRRLGYGRCWLPMSALGLALTWQARICFHHSCESDLFQVRNTTYVYSALFLSPEASIGKDWACSVQPSKGCEGLLSDDYIIRDQ